MSKSGMYLQLWACICWSGLVFAGLGRCAGLGLYLQVWDVFAALGLYLQVLVVFAGVGLHLQVWDVFAALTLYLQVKPCKLQFKINVAFGTLLGNGLAHHLGC